MSNTRWKLTVTDPWEDMLALERQQRDRLVRRRNLIDRATRIGIALILILAAFAFWRAL